jgi:signal transduction histidine kinase
MAFFFALTAIMTAAILSGVLAYVWEGEFQGYTRQNMQRLVQSTADALSTHYVQEDGWTSNVLSYVSTYVGDITGVGVEVLDSEGTVILEDAPSTLKNKEESSDNETDGAVAVVSADVHDSTGAKVGSVRMWAYGSSALLTEADENFRTNSYNAIVWAALIAIALASLIGYFASRQLVKPINRITSTAAQIRNGDLTARSKLSGDDEIGRLGETFDEMATSLESDIKHERRLTGDVAHELRTPLMAIQATVEAMQDGVLPADEEHLQTVDDEVRRLSRLVDAMLHLSRLENGKLHFNPERTDVVYLVRSLVDMQERLFADRGLRLRFDDKTPHHELYADIDPDGIREAVTNLISNAMRYTPEGGWVLVSVAQGRGDILISVRDTGIGIAKEDIPKTFSRFWRSDASRERVSGGLGVGLAITKGIIDQHNGTISVESELGRGTTFTLRIPYNQKRRGRHQEHPVEQEQKDIEGATSSSSDHTNDNDVKKDKGEKI